MFCFISSFQLTYNILNYTLEVFLENNFVNQNLVTAVVFTLPIRNLIYNVSLGSYLPYEVKRDREASLQRHFEQQI